MKHKRHFARNPLKDSFGKIPAVFLRLLAGCSILLVLFLSGLLFSRNSPLSFPNDANTIPVNSLQPSAEPEESERSRKTAELTDNTEREKEKPNLKEESGNPTYLLAYTPLDLSEIPPYKDSPYVILNNNIPTFTDEDRKNPVFEYYSDLDDLNRCGIVSANLCKELMPTENRSSIGTIKPSGWHTVTYPEVIPDRYLYNRCHLISYSLAGENDNEKNLITGTRYMNVVGMLGFEEHIASYIRSTGHHVLYRVVPAFYGSDLVARGVHMEAESIEDNGEGISFNVFVYNVQPDIGIDYATGDSWRIK